MSKKIVVGLVAVAVLGLALVAGLAVGYWWFAKRSQPIGPLPAEAAILPGDAAVVGGIDVRRITTGANYKKYMAAAMEDAGKDLKELEQKTGINVERDVEGLYGAGSKVGAEQAGVVVLVGTFDAQRIGKAVQDDPKSKATTTTVEGFTVYEMKEEGKVSSHLAVPSARVLVAGTPALVATTLANFKGGQGGVAANAELVAALKAVEPGPAFWLLATPKAMAEAPKPGEGMPVPPFPMPKSVLFTGQFDPAVSFKLTGEMADEAAAKQLAEQITGLKAMAAMFAADKPEVGEAAQALSVTNTGKSVVVALSLSPALLEKIQKSLLEARLSANEAATVGDTRTVISAQAAYQAMGDGSYGELKCLADPKSCNASYDGPQFIDKELAEATTKSGYNRQFKLADGSFAYASTPVKAGDTGKRSFCGDASGMICQNADGAPFDISSGRCPEGCTPVE